MNDKIEFRFCTRTRSQGHRVFYDDGNKTLSYTEEFEAFEKIAQTADDAEKSAVVFEKGGKIYLAAFGLKRNAFDIPGRRIRFSFCRIFPKSEAEKAMNAFTRLSEEWNETEKKVDDFIEEFPVIRPAVIRENFIGREEPGEDVKFNSKEFLDWLDEKSAEYDLPKVGKMLKYLDGERVKTMPLGRYRERDEDKESGESHTHKPIILLAVLLIVVSVIGYSLLGKGRSDSSATQQQPQQDQPSNPSGEVSNLSGDVLVISQDMTITSSKKTTGNEGEPQDQ